MVGILSGIILHSANHLAPVTISRSFTSLPVALNSSSIDCPFLEFRKIAATVTLYSSQCARFESFSTVCTVLCMQNLTRRISMPALRPNTQVIPPVRPPRSIPLHLLRQSARNSIVNWRIGLALSQIPSDQPWAIQYPQITLTILTFSPGTMPQNTSSAARVLFLLPTPRAVRYCRSLFSRIARNVSIAVANSYGRHRFLCGREHTQTGIECNRKIISSL